MRFTPTLLVRVMAQMDSDDENTRIVAMGKAREMLSAGRVTFAMLCEYAMNKLQEEEDAENGRSRSPTQSGVRNATARTAEKFSRSTQERPYLHKRVAGRFARTHEGRPVVRGSMPPRGSYGRLRVLSDVEDDASFGYRKLKLSLETHEALYEAFEYVSNDRHVLGGIRDCSISGAPFECL